MGQPCSRQTPCCCCCCCCCCSLQLISLLFKKSRGGYSTWEYIKLTYVNIWRSPLILNFGAPRLESGSQIHHKEAESTAKHWNDIHIWVEAKKKLRWDEMRFEGSHWEPFFEWWVQVRTARTQSSRFSLLCQMGPFSCHRKLTRPVHVDMIGFYPPGTTTVTLKHHCGTLNCLLELRVISLIFMSGFYRLFFFFFFLFFSFGGIIYQFRAGQRWHC